LFCQVLRADDGRWYEIRIADSPCGYLHETSEQVDGVVRTCTDERFVVARAGRNASLEQFVCFEETPRGKPLRARVQMDAGGEPSIQLYTFTETGFTMVVQQRGREWAEEVLMDDMDWLTPAEAAAFVEARIKSGARRIKYRTVEPSDQMSIIEVRSELVGHESRDVLGRETKLGRWRTSTSHSPLELIELRADDGTVVSARVDIGIGEMTMELVDEKRAREALSSPAPELMVTTVVAVQGMPDSSDRLERARYLVRAPGVSDLPFPDSGAQRVHQREDGAVEIDLDAGRGSAASPDELSDEAFSRPSTLVDSADPEVIAFMNRALRRASDAPEARAEALRRAVGSHITRKNFATAFGSASDAVRDRTGDCTEHSVLLAAALRADGIPSRVATGLVHGRFQGASDGGFAWHMWTQALVDGHWIDLDATRREPFDAGHLLVSTSSLRRGSGEQELSEMLPLLGRLRIQVLELDGRQVEGDDR